MKLLLEGIGPKWNKKKEKKSEKRKRKKPKTKTTVSLDSLGCFCWNCVACLFLCLLSLRSRVGIGSPSSFVGVLFFLFLSCQILWFFLRLLPKFFSAIQRGFLSQKYFRGLCFGLILCSGWWGGGGGGGGAWDCLFSEIHTLGRLFSVLLWILRLASFCRSWKICNLEIYVPVGVVLVL